MTLQDLGLSDPSLNFFLYDEDTVGPVTPHSRGSPRQMAQHLHSTPNLTLISQRRGHTPLSTAYFVAATFCLHDICGHWPPRAGFLFQSFLGSHRALAEGWGPLIPAISTSVLSWELGNAPNPVQAKVRSTLLTPLSPQEPADEQGGFPQDSSCACRAQGSGDSWMSCLSPTTR